MPQPQPPSGTLDPSFGMIGIVTTPIGVEAHVRAAVLQPNGKVIVAGGTYDGTRWNFVLLRYNGDATLDPAFGQGGKVVTAVGQGGQAEALALRPDGKIVVVGSTTIATADGFRVRCAFVHYGADGMLDTEFGGGGIVLSASPFSATDCSASVVKPDGKVVSTSGFNNPLPGGTNSASLSTTQFNADGSVDTFFGTGGTAYTPCTAFRNDYNKCLAHAVVIQPDGRVVVVGESSSTIGIGPIAIDASVAVARYEANGQPDAGFGNGGVATVGDFHAQQITARAVALQGGGKIVIAGAHGDPVNVDFMLARLQSTGAPDPSFGAASVVSTDFTGGLDDAYAIALQQNGKIVVTGATATTNTGPNGQFALARYNDHGDLDASFGTNGKVATTIGGFVAATVLLIQPDGRILAVGHANSGSVGSFAVARYFGDTAN